MSNSYPKTFDLRVIEDDIYMECRTNEKKHVKTYDLTHHTPYYDSFPTGVIKGIERYGLT